MTKQAKTAIPNTKATEQSTSKLAKVRAAVAAKTAVPITPPEQPKARRAPTAAAHGATDGAPHTKRAVAQTAAAERVTAKADFEGQKAEQAAAGRAYYLLQDGTHGWYLPAVRFTVKQGGAPAHAVLVWPKSKAEQTAKASAAPKATATAKPSAPPKAKAAPKARTTADRSYKVINRDHGARPGSKRATQLAIVFAHTSTAAAKAAGAESVDFSFAEAKGFIRFA